MLQGDGRYLVEGGDVWVRDGKVQDHMNLFYGEKVTPSMEYDCSGLIVAPGFIDIQINGTKCTHPKSAIFDKQTIMIIELWQVNIVVSLCSLENFICLNRVMRN